MPRVGAPVRLCADGFIAWRAARKRVAVSTLGTAASITDGRAAAGGRASIVPRDLRRHLSDIPHASRHLQRRGDVLSSRGMPPTSQGTLTRHPAATSRPTGRRVALQRPVPTL